jgi:hypothetical protein
MAQQFCQGCGASLMPTLRMCPTCGSKNLDANQPLSPPTQLSSSQATNIPSPSTATSSSSQLKGLGGWLILVGFGLVFGLLRLIVDVSATFKPYIGTDLLDKLTNSNSASYIPNFNLLFYAESAISIFLVLMCLYLIILFFTKNKKFPKYYIFITLFIILSIPLDTYIASVIISKADVWSGETIKSIFQALFSGAIWIPYMLKSKRVRNTFIED